MLARYVLVLVIAVIVLSPLAYVATGVGQNALALGQDLVVLGDGSLYSSPRAEALYSLTLPLRIQQLLLYPLLLLLVQVSGLAVRLRAGLAGRWVPRLQHIPGFRWLDRLLGRLFLSDVALVILYVSLFTLGLTLVNLPLSFYQGYVLGHQFGLSTQTIEAWARDFALGLGLDLAMTLVLFVGFYGLLKLMPRRWPLVGGMAMAILAFAMVLLEPILVTPLFYEITPVTDPALRARIDTMAARAGVVIDQVSVIDASTKTTAVNAYFTGLGDASQIVLWDTLLAYPPDEVDVVIAHEMGHWVYHHVLLMLMLGCAGGWFFLFALRFWLHRVWQRLGWTGPDDVAGYPYLLAVLAFVSILALPFMNGLSRVAENQADDFALRIGQRPAAMSRMFKRLAVENLAMLDVAPWEEVIFYSHPPLGERIEKAERVHSSQ
ncbi:MAG: M48 family metallopeptidase [Chloroflexi bacterium]|nr:M48 family metallopeptidase [Chloroflexota bacterium]MBU1751698.1 M48 family metallopeptidase [Chloroflexota bacterium]MBU1880223.1 M48 family metallopeptidase [Chloroflexota bacterium]